MTSKLRFARPELARSMAESLSGRHKWNSDADGLFLSAPRRTGKSTFLKGDLRPALEAAGVEVIYLDLWTNLQADPTDLLYAEVSRVLLAHAGFIPRTAEKAKLAKATVGAGGSTLEFDATRIGQTAGSSLMAALRELTEVAGKPVALILDEAQHLLVSARGDDVLKELKAARDTLNSPEHIRLMLVMSGSDRDKLGRLTNSKSAAFYGSRIKPMPLLGEDYVAWLSGLLAQSNPNLGRIDAAVLTQAFTLLGHRPKEMDAAIGNALNPVTSAGVPFEQSVLEHAQAIVQAEYARYADRYQTLSPVQQAVLTVLLETGDTFSPYAASTLKACAALLGKKDMPTASVQSALEKLRKLDPPMVWKSNRGEYALDDLGMVEWYMQTRATVGWPPTGLEPDPVA